MRVRTTVLLLVLGLSAHADTLILRNGTRVTGRWWATDANVVNFLVNDRLVGYSRSEVIEVVFGSEPAALPAPMPATPAPATAPPPAASTRPAAPIVSEPDQIGAIYFQQDSGNLRLLERTVGVPHRVSRNGASQYWDMEGPRSPFRLKSGPKLLFVVKMPYGIAPGAFSLYPLETKGSTRRTKAGPGNSLAMTIPLSIRRVTGDIYILAPSEQLAPGEYSFSPAKSNDAYCFGIDPGGR
jgi:hypothetical protein